MRKFVGICASVAVLSFVSCGAREESSDLSSHHQKHPGNNTNDHYDHSRDTLPGQVNGREDGRFPEHPEASVTPGSLCENSQTFRYPEHVKYCDRDVDPSLKAAIFVEYDKKFNFETTQMQRMAFKIDHLIPLCLGGSNNQNNLWPQHKTIYENTDPLEPFLCQVLSAGKIKQAEAVKILLEIKKSPFTAGEELRKLESKY
ncbi:MAG: hypothetical protein WCO71_08615 [Pseudomonadota bacterium]